MKKLTIKKGIYEYQLQIDKIKYCIGTDFKNKYQLKKMIIEYFNGGKTSEYSKQNTGDIQLMINEKLLNCKDVLFFYVNDNYSIENELKLKSKSLMSIYLETLLSDNQYIDTIQSINILLDAFASEIDDDLIISKFITYTPKQFLKILLPMFCYDEEQANEHDLSYDEIIIFQLKMINYIARNQLKMVIVFIEIPELTRSIDNALKEMKNVIIIISVFKYNVNLEIDNVMIFDQIILDVNDEEQLYNYFINKKIYTLKEAKDMIKQKIKDGINKFDVSILND